MIDPSAQQAQGPAEPPAWAEPGTRAAWVRHRRGAWLLLIVGIVVAVGTGADAVRVWRADADLLAGGHRTTGVVLDGDQNDGGRRNLTQSTVEVRYVVRDATFEGTLHGPGPDDLPKGSRVTIVYAPASPARFRTERYANRSDQTDVAIHGGPTFGAFFLIAGAGAMSRSRRWRRWLQAGPWQLRHAVRGRSGLLGGRPLLRLTDAGDSEEIVRFDQAWDPSLEKFALTDDGLVGYLPGPGRRGLVAARGQSRPFQVRTPRTPRQRARWLRRLENTRADYLDDDG